MADTQSTPTSASTEATQSTQATSTTSTTSDAKATTEASTGIKTDTGISAASVSLGQENATQKTPEQIAYPDQYYAWYDPKVEGQSPVKGWFDMWGYSSMDGLPPLTELLALSKEYWDSHITSPQTPRAVENGKIVDYVPPITLETQQYQLSGITAQKKSAGVYFKPAAASAEILFPSSDSDYTFALQQAQAVMLDAWTDGTPWNLPNNETIAMTSDDVKGLYKKMAAYRQACQTYSAKLGEELKTNINTDLTVGWPDNH